MAAIAAKTAAIYLKNIPESQHKSRYLLSVSPEDWTRGNCECEKCQAIMKKTGSYSGLLLHFVNQFARELEKDYPWVTVTSLAYRHSKKPPNSNIRVRKNVVMRFCTDYGSSFDWPYHSFYDANIAEMAQQHKYFDIWQNISPRMHIWTYPHQYRHHLAPMPSIRAMAENLRFFKERGIESVFLQQADYDRGREMMRFWIFSKLLWNSSLNVDDLMCDFIWGYYGKAAPAVYEYEQLLSEYNAKYTNFSCKRGWIYPIHQEEMFKQGFIEKARKILDRAIKNAEDDETRKDVELLKAGVVYVEAVQLYMQMRTGSTAPDKKRYLAVKDEFAGLCKRLEISRIGFFDGGRTIAGISDWLNAMDEEYSKRFDQRYLPSDKWGAWIFRRDPKDLGVKGNWYRANPRRKDDWVPVEVPAFLSKTKDGITLETGTLP